MRAWVLTAMAALTAGCSSYCDFRQGSVNGAEGRCQERVNTIATEAFKAACTAAQGAPGNGACPRDGVIGGCYLGAQGDGSKVNDWYYAPMTVDEAKRACSGDGTWLDP